MTREEQLKFCQVCKHRQMDMRQGLLCGLTHEKADFDGTCANYQPDEKAIEKYDKKQEEILHDEDHTIGGWLAFFLWFGLGLGTLLGIVIGIILFIPLYDFSYWLTAGMAILLVCLGILAILTIRAFYKRQSNAIALAGTYLAIMAAQGVFSLLMFFLLDVPSTSNYLIGAIQSFAWVAIWGMYLAFSVRVQNIVPKPRSWHLAEKCLLGIGVAMYALLCGVLIEIAKKGNDSVFCNPRFVVKTSIKIYNAHLYPEQGEAYLQKDTIVYPYTLSEAVPGIFDDNSAVSVRIVWKQLILQSFALQSNNEPEMVFFFKHNYSLSYRYFGPNGNFLCAYTITPDEYNNALAQGADYRCGESDFQTAEDIANASLPTTFIWDDATLTKVSHTSDSMYYHICFTDLTYAEMSDIGLEALQDDVREHCPGIVDNMVRLARINRMNIVFILSGYDSEQSMDVVITPQDSGYQGRIWR